MLIKIIFVVFNFFEVVDSVIEIGVVLVNKYDVYLIVVYVEVLEQVFIYVLMEIFDFVVIMVLQEVVEQCVVVIQVKFFFIIECEGVLYEWCKFCGVGGYFLVGVVDSVCSIDLVFCVQFDEKILFVQCVDIEVLIFECGCFVIMVFYIQIVLKLIECVLIVWNGFCEVVCVVFDVMLFFIGVKEVEIFFVDVCNDMNQLVDFVGFEFGVMFVCYGIKVNVNNVEFGGKLIGVVIENCVLDFFVDLFVMGVYIYLCICECIFGGVIKMLFGLMMMLMLMLC